MNFELNTEFFIMIGMFLTIAFIITIIIVYFMTKVNTLSSFLEQAKEIDEVKVEKISALETLLQEEKIYNVNIMKQLEYFEKNKKMLFEKDKDIAHLKENINLQSQEHMESIHNQKMNYKELTSKHNILNENYDILIEKYRLLQKRNETLVQDNNNLHTRLRETQVQLNEQKKQNIKKMALMKEHRGALKREFEQLAMKIFDGNSKEFSRLSEENISSMIKPLASQIDYFKKQVNTLYSDESKDSVMLKQETTT